MNNTKEKLTIKQGDQRFYIEDDEHNLLAEITYIIKDNSRYLVNHTFVEQSLRGQGIAADLVMAMVEYVRKEKGKIIPVCPYVVKCFQKNPAILDTLAEEARSILW